VALTCLSLIPASVDASGNAGRGNAAAPKTTAPRGPSVKTRGPSAPKHAPTVKGSGAGSKAMSPRATAKAANADAKASASKKTSGAPTTTSPGTTPIDFTTTPVGQRLSKNSALRSKLETRLEALGYSGTVYQAAYGFKNQGQLVAAINVSQNLDVPFEQLKLQMTGYSVSKDGTVLRANLNPDGTISMVDPSLATDPAPTKSLGQSIQTFKTDVDADAAATTATTQANREIAAR
jgi:hypothetical protein